MNFISILKKVNQAFHESSVRTQQEGGHTIFMTSMTVSLPTEDLAAVF